MQAKSGGAGLLEPTPPLLVGMQGQRGRLWAGKLQQQSGYH